MPICSTDVEVLDNKTDNSECAKDCCSTSFQYSKML